MFLKEQNIPFSFLILKAVFYFVKTFTVLVGHEEDLVVCWYVLIDQELYCCNVLLLAVFKSVDVANLTLFLCWQPIYFAHSK